MIRDYFLVKNFQSFWDYSKYYCVEAGSVGKQGKAEKAMSTSKDSVSKSAKETSEDKPDEEKGVGNSEDDEPLVSWKVRP